MAMNPQFAAGGAPFTPDLAPAKIPQYELGKLATPTAPSLANQALAQVPTGATNAFENTLGRLVTDVAQKSAVAADAVAGLTSGVPLHQAVIAMEESSVAFQLMVEVRNKLLESYQELMRMQV